MFHSSDSKMVVAIKRHLEQIPANSVCQSYLGSKRIIKLKKNPGAGAEKWPDEIEGENFESCIEFKANTF